MKRWLVALGLVGSFLVLGERRGYAQPRASSALDYRVAGEDCPTEAEFRELVAARVGADPFVRDASRTFAITTRLQAKGILEVRITVLVDGSTSSKVLHGDPRQCAELLQRAALTVSLAVEVEEEAPARESSEASELPEGPPPVEPPPAVRGEPKPPPPRAGIGAAAAVHAGGAAVHPGLGLEVLASYRWEVVSLGIVGRAVLPTSESFAIGRVSTTNVGAGPIVCLGSRRFDVCVPVTAGAVLGSGGEVADSLSDASPFVTAGVRPQIHVSPFRRFDVIAFIEGYLAPASTSFRFRGGTAWTTAPTGALVGMSGTIGIF